MCKAPTAASEWRDKGREARQARNWAQVGCPTAGPPRATNPGWPNPDLGPGWGWASYILPGLEQDNVKKLINVSVPVGNGDPNTTTARTTFLDIFSCPSDPVFVRTFSVSDGGSNSWQLAHGSYVACNGNDGVDDFTTAPHSGAFLRGLVGCRIAEFPDGLSNTFFVGERSTSMSVSTWAGVIPGAQVPSVRAPASFSGASALVLGHCGPHLPNDNIVTDADAMSSGHGLGVSFLFGDGSVRLIGNSIAVPVYDALATRGGQEPVDAGSFS